MRTLNEYRLDTLASGDAALVSAAEHLPVSNCRGPRLGLIQPMFHSERIDAYADSFVELTEALDSRCDGDRNWLSASSVELA